MTERGIAVYTDYPIEPATVDAAYGLVEDGIEHHRPELLRIHVMGERQRCTNGPLCSGWLSGDDIHVKFESCTAKGALVHEMAHFILNETGHRQASRDHDERYFWMRGSVEADARLSLCLFEGCEGGCVPSHFYVAEPLR